VPAAQQIEDKTTDFNPSYHQAGDTIDNMDRYYYVEMVEQLVGSLAHLAGVGSALPPTPSPTASNTATAVPSPTATSVPTDRATQLPTHTATHTSTAAPSLPPSNTPSPTTVAPTLPPPVTSEPTDPKPTTAPTSAQSAEPGLGIRAYLPFALVESK
jgi:hypothetical protein